jgi:hypothetical protein
MNVKTVFWVVVTAIGAGIILWYGVEWFSDYMDSYYEKVRSR